MAFNWDDHPLVRDPSGFNWEDHPIADTSPSISTTESGLRGLAQGASLGFADELTGGAEALWNKAKGDPTEFGKLYEKARDESRANYDKAREANPGIYTTGEVGGGIATAFVPGLNVAKGASLTKLAAEAALQGGLMGAGYSNADNAADVALDAGKGAALGGALGAGGGAIANSVSPYLEKGIQKISSGTGDLADRFASRALGAERGTIKKFGADKVKAAGRQALDEGVISPLGSTEGMIAKNTALKKSGGEMMGQAYDAIDSAGASTFNPLEVATKVEDKIGDFYRSPINRGESNQLENTLESILMRGDENIPLSEAQKLKEELGKVANWKNNLNITDKEKMAREAYGVVSDHIDDAVKNGAEAVDAAGLSNTLKKGKELYGKSKTAEALLENKQAREQGNNIIGLTDAITGAGALGYGGTTGDWQTAGGVMLAKKGLQKYGSSTAAIGLDKVSKMLMKSPKMVELYSKNPKVFSMIAQKMENKLMGSSAKVADDDSRPYEKEALLQKTQGTKYQGVLENAAKRGDRATAATNFILQSTDPNYRKLILDQDKQENDGFTDDGQ